MKYLTLFDFKKSLPWSLNAKNVYERVMIFWDLLDFNSIKLLLKKSQVRPPCLTYSGQVSPWSRQRVRLTLVPRLTTPPPVTTSDHGMQSLARDTPARVVIITARTNNILILK